MKVSIFILIFLMALGILSNVRDNVYQTSGLENINPDTGVFTVQKTGRYRFRDGTFEFEFENVAHGYQALDAVSTGSNNTVLGYRKLK